MGNINLAETIAEITNIKSLEVYRSPSMLTQEARVAIDGHLIDLSTRLVKALDLLPGDDQVEIEFKVPARTFEAEAKKSAEILAPKAPKPPGQTEPSSRHEIADEIEAYMAEQGISMWKAADSFGVSGQIVANIFDKNAQPRKATLEKIRHVINKTKQKPQPAPVTKIRTAKGPAQFIQLKLATWMATNKLGVKDAGGRLGIAESSVRDLMNGVIVHENILRQVGLAVPDIGNNLHDLIKQLRSI